MRTLPRVTHARSGVKEYEIYVGDLIRQVESHAGSGLYPPLPRPGSRLPAPAAVRTVSSEFS